MKVIERKSELPVPAFKVRAGLMHSLVFCLALCLTTAVFSIPFVTAMVQAQQAVAAEKPPEQLKPLCPDISWKSSKEFTASIQSCRKNEETKYLEQRYSRAIVLMNNKDLVRDREIRAFLLTPRERFCRKWNLSRAYDHAYLDIHYGVTISGPHLVGRMTSALDVQPGDKVLEIGTGSGYHSAMLSNLTDKVYTVEIIDPLEKETDRIYEQLANSGYSEYANIKRKSDDGYYGWEELRRWTKLSLPAGSTTFRRPY